MSHKHDESVVSRHIEIYESDWLALQEWFGRQSEARLGVSVAIRKIIRKGVKEYRERIARRGESSRQPVQAIPAPSLDKFFANSTSAPKATPSDAAGVKPDAE